MKLSNNIRLTALISQVCIELTPRRDMCSKTCNSHQLLKKNSSCPVFKRETDLFGRLVNVETVLLCDTGMFLRKSFSNRSSFKFDATLQYFTAISRSNTFSVSKMFRQIDGMKTLTLFSFRCVSFFLGLRGFRSVFQIAFSPFALFAKSEPHPRKRNRDYMSF